MPRPKAEPRPCLVCSTPFQPNLQQLELGHGLYCSRQCHGIAIRKPVDRTCEWCGTPFVTNTARAAQRPGKYCSMPCRLAAVHALGKSGSYRRETSLPLEVSCAQCGKAVVMIRRVKHYRRNRGVLYCSPTCSGLARRLRPEPDITRRWNNRRYYAWRKAVLKRDAYTCQECGYRCPRLGSTLNAHHIKGWSAYPDLRYDVENGVSLCLTCHRDKHPSTRESLTG